MLRVKRGTPEFILVANKVDKSYEREVTREEGEALAEEMGCQFIEVSAKTGQKVESVFSTLVRKLRGTPTEVGTAVNVNRRTPRARKKSGCVVM